MALLLNACVEHPQLPPDPSKAQLRSWVEIFSVNGDTPDDRYEITLLAGKHQLQVLYKTYQKEYLCQFDFETVGGRSYEIVDHSNPEPLVLYRWQRANGVWAERLDPVAPRCSERMPQT